MRLEAHRSDQGRLAPTDAPSARSSAEGAFDAPRSGPTWKLRVDTAPDAQTANHRASLFALSNGVLGVRGGIEEQEGGAGETFLSAVFDRTPIFYHERFAGFATASDTRVPVVDGAAMLVTLEDGGALGEIVAFEQILDLAAGSSSRRTRWRSAGGASIEVLAERAVPVEGEALLAIRFRLTSIDYTGAVSIRSRLERGRRGVAQGDDPRLGAGAGARMVTLSSAAEGLDAVMIQKGSAADMRTACVQTHRLVAGQIALEGDFAELESCGSLLRGRLAPGESLVLEKIVAYAFAVDGDEAELAQAAQRLAARHADIGFESLKAEHARALGVFWDEAAIDAPDTPELEAALRYNLFQLRQNAPRDGKTGIAAKGISGEGYEGHCFWDAEVFACPVLSVTAPSLARSQLMFRAGTLDRARRHAREMNHARGALIPWRTIAGDEASAYYPGGSAQYHINADVAFAVRIYDRATGDEAFLLEHGAELVLETARIWLQIGAFNPRRGGAFCITGVTGPDEYTALIDNDYYTNRMAKAHLSFACEVVDRLMRDHPVEGPALLGRLGVDAEETDTWRRAAAAMCLPVDQTLGVHPQDDTFLDKPPWDFQAAGAERPLLLHVHPLTLYRCQVCKQASVVLAHTLTASEDLALKQRDFDYYERVTVHDSSLSASSFSILAADIGEMDKAAAYLHDTAFVDLDDLHGNTDHGLHMAAAAGSWMALVWGWGGFRPQGETPRFRPVRSDAAPRYAFRVLWRGRRLRVQVDATGVLYTLLGGAPLIIDHDGLRLELTTMAPTQAPTPAPRPAHREALVRREPPTPILAALIDLDGVLTDTAQAHYQAWKAIADQIGAPFDEQANEALKGVDRMASLEILLRRAPAAVAAGRQALADRKNSHYLDLIANFGPDNLFAGAREALVAARQAGLKLALVSASRNARSLVERLGVADLFDHMVDPASLARGKPDPEIYLRAAAALHVAPGACIGLEDAKAGVEGLRAAGVYSVGIGDPAVLDSADAVVSRIASLRWERFLGP